ncbi:hypothetical protein SC65A3_01082 [Psychrobacter sp. SC65A.3]|nr:hypothetical protein SC65A3_01082 [Psychrobacter sp. SC65A.3]
MQNLMLHDILYTQLDPMTMTWCATAKVRASHCDIKKTTTCLAAPQIAYNQRQQQRAGVRLLLQALLKRLDIVDCLDESNFPYRLTHSQYYVCFSHTNGNNKNATRIQNDIENSDIPYVKVAVVISRYRPSGIDIEVNAVKWQVAKRFYHPKELAILQALPMIQRNSAIKCLWQIKENFIKIDQYTLAQGLGMDYSAIIIDVLNQPIEILPLLTLTDDKTNYRISVISSQQTVIVY